MDNTATAFQTHLPDDKEVPTRILPNNFPTLNSPAQNSWEAWNTSDRSYEVNTVVNGLASSFFPSLRSFLQVDGARALVWCMDARDEAPSQFTFDSDITAFGLIHYNEYSNVLVFCTGRKVELHIACQYPGAPSPHYVQAGLVECTCPHEVTAFAASGDGQALLGTRTGAVYQLTIQADGQTLLEGIRHRLDRLHWEWKRYFGRVAPVKVIHVDALRNLAYALHSNSEINVFSLEPSGVFGGKPIRIANLERGRDGPILTSIHALPRFGFRDCVLVGCAPTGECFFYYLEPSVSGKWKLETRNLTKKAKTYCGFGLDKNLVMKYQNKVSNEYLSEVLGEGFGVSVANVLDTTIILNGYNPGTDQTALFELKLAINGQYDLSLIPASCCESQGGRIEGVVKWEEPNDHFRGAQRLPEQLLWEDELNRQMFYDETKFLIFTKTHHRRMKKESHSQTLIKILNLVDSGELLDQFLDSYSPQETAAMLVFLRVCNYDVLKAFAESSRVMDHAMEGVHLFLKRILAPVWLNPVLGLEPADFIFLKKDSVFVKMNKEEFQFYKGYLERLKDVLSEFMIFLGIRIYRNGSIYCPISGPLSLEEARSLKDLREFVEKLNSVILFIEKLSECKNLSIKECTKKETLLSVLDMSLRDFVSFAIYDRDNFLDFLNEIRLQLGDYDWKFMNHFILKEAPFLLQKPEENDTQTAEDEEGQVLPLGERISMMNERLHQVKETEPCSAKRKRKIRDHYNDVFVECTDLMNAYDYEGLSREFLERCKEFIINVKTVEDQMVQDIIWKVILGANFAQPEILKLDPLFEELLTSQLKQVLEKRRLPLSLDQHQLQAIDTMIQLLKAQGRELETAELHVTLALRERHPSVQIVGLAERIAHLKVALRSFQSLRRRTDSNLTQTLIDNLVRQKEIVKLVRTRYAGVEMEEEDKEFLDELECRQSSLMMLRDLVKVCLEDDDEQTAKAFEGSRFKNVGELIEELEVEH